LNNTPSAARRSKFGVWTIGCPANPKQSPRHWSAVISNTFCGLPELLLNGYFLMQ
jgi:hypothetical protein